MFIRLGILSITRQLSRSALVLVTLMLAAISLTANLTISSGYPAQAYRNYRDYVGGDIVAYPVRIMTSPSAHGQLALYTLPASELSTLTMFYPHIAEVGFLSSEPPIMHAMTQAEWEALSSHPEVTSVRPLYRLPVWRELAGAEYTAALRAITVGDPLHKHITNQLEEDRYTGAIPVWLNSRQLDNPLPILGQEFELTVPGLLTAPDGSVQTDGTKRFSLTAQVVGFYSLPTREISWPDGQGGMMSEQGYFNLDEVWLLEDDWQRFWRLAMPGQEPQAFSYGIDVRNLGILESVASELQVNNPALTIVSAPNLARMAQRALLIDHFKLAPQEYLNTESKPQFGLPQDMGRLLSFFVYLNAGLLMAARMLTGASARRKEIGILKAIGGRRRDIMLMALTEAVVLSVIGSTAGFFLTYTAAFLQQLTNRVAISLILLDLGRNYSLVIGQTVVIGLAFGLVPAWRLSKLTVNEVLRS